jgi:hypothetical protein
VPKVKSSTAQLLYHLTTHLLSSFVVAESPCVFVVFVFVSSWQLIVGYRLRIMGHEKIKNVVCQQFVALYSNNKQRETGKYKPLYFFKRLCL